MQATHVLRGRQSYDICTGVELLLLAVVLILGPVLELDGGVGASRNRRDVAELVALVTGFDVRDVLDNLCLEVAGLVGV